MPGLAGNGEDRITLTDDSPIGFVTAAGKSPEQGANAYFFGASANHIDEYGLILSLMEQRATAAVSNFTQNVLLRTLPNSDVNDLLNRRFEQFGALTMTENFIREVAAGNHLVFGLDYLWSPEGMKRTFPLWSGEGYPPLHSTYEVPERFRSEYRMAPRWDSKFPNFISAPNGDFYPKSERYIVFTSSDRSIATRYGEIVLEIEEETRRGISLPEYCKSVHGPGCLTHPHNISYWEEGDRDEYVIPAYIPARDIRGGSVKYLFDKIKSLGREMRIYQKNRISATPQVDLFDHCGRLVGTFRTDVGGQIRFTPESAMVSSHNVSVVHRLLNGDREIDPVHPELLVGRKPLLAFELEQVSGLDFDRRRDLFWFVEDRSSSRGARLVAAKLNPSFVSIVHRPLTPGDQSVESELRRLLKKNGSFDFEAVRIGPDDRLIIAWEGRENALLVVEPDSGRIERIVKLDWLTAAEPNRGVEGLAFHPLGNQLFIGVELPPRLFALPWQSSHARGEEITLPRVVKSISELAFDDGGTRADASDDRLIVVDRDSGNLVLLDLDGRIRSCLALELLDQDDRSYSAASPEAVYIAYDGNLVVATDPFKGRYRADISNDSLEDLHYRNHVPMIYRIKRTR